MLVLVLASKLSLHMHPTSDTSEAARFLRRFRPDLTELTRSKSKEKSELGPT